MDSSEIRDISSIKKDLSKIDDSIRLCNRCIEQYPEKKSLKFSLKSIENRRSLLLKEMELAYERTNKSLFDMSLSKSESNDITALELGGTLTSFQELITSIIYHENIGIEAQRGPVPDKFKNMSTVNVAATSTGSFRVIFSDTLNIYSYSDEETPIIKALERINRLIDGSEDLEKLKELNEEFGPRVFIKYSNFMEHISKNHLNLILYDELGSGRYEKRVVPKEFSNRTHQLLSLITKKFSESKKLKGEIHALDIKKRTFSFTSDENHQISGKYAKNLENKLSKWDFHKLVVCKFEHGVSYREAHDKEIDKWTLLEIDE